MKRPALILARVLCLWIVAAHLAAEPTASYRIVESLEIDHVPSWFPVGFCLLTHSGKQYVAYYDKEHRMVVACRRLGETTWKKVVLPSKVGWDSHNYITMRVDKEGHIHLAGNMHCVPLIYFRTREPGDIATFERSTMTGDDENRCTYPRFLEDADGNLLFTYRSGGSGNGRRLYNRYDNGSKTWSRFLDTPLFDGEGQRNAYPLGPTRGPDGLFHVLWVWRDTPDCATNHHLSYSRSRDLKKWESAGGQPASLPLTLEQAALCVDPVAPGGGIINGCERLAFDSRHRPLVAYHKSDEHGHMQVYLARFEEKGWRRVPVTTWKKTIEFSGGGAMPFIGIKVGELKRHEEGLFSVGYRHRDYGSGRIVIDEETLQPVDRQLKGSPKLPGVIRKPTIEFEGIRVKMTYDLGDSPEADTRYLLRWETLDANYDRPRKPPLPPASVLKLVQVELVK